MVNYFRWLIQDQVIYYRIIGEVSSDDIYPVDAYMNARMDESPADKVHLVIDSTLMTVLPNVPTTMRLTYLRHPKLGTVVTNERSPVESFIFNTIGKVFKLSYRFVKNWDDALRFLRENDDTLPPMDVLHQRLQLVQQETLQEHQHN
ncbi:MAG: hypothetical protein AAF846_17090 [Chloroflexota bacterium]